jgi:hypothetical protein
MYTGSEFQSIVFKCLSMWTEVTGQVMKFGFGETDVSILLW